MYYLAIIRTKCYLKAIRKIAYMLNEGKRLVDGPRNVCEEHIKVDVQEIDNLIVRKRNYI